MEPVVLGERHEELVPQLGVQQHDAHAVADCVAEVQPRDALLRQCDQVAETLPLELALEEEHLSRGSDGISDGCTYTSAARRTGEIEVRSSIASTLQELPKADAWRGRAGRMGGKVRDEY